MRAIFIHYKIHPEEQETWNTLPLSPPWKDFNAAPLANRWTRHLLLCRSLMLEHQERLGPNGHSKEFLKDLSLCVYSIWQH